MPNRVLVWRWSLWAPWASLRVFFSGLGFCFGVLSFFPL